MNPLCRPNVTRPPIYYEMYAMYRNQMGECLGFDPAAHAMLAPRLRLMVVDRHYHSGGWWVGGRVVFMAQGQRVSCNLFIYSSVCTYGG